MIKQNDIFYRSFNNGWFDLDSIIAIQRKNLTFKFNFKGKGCTGWYMVDKTLYDKDNRAYHINRNIQSLYKTKHVPFFYGYFDYWMKR